MRIGFGTCLELSIPLYKPRCPRVPASFVSLISFSILASIIMSVTLVNDTDIALQMHTGVYATDEIFIWPGEEKSITGLWTTWPYNPRAVKIRFLSYRRSTPELQVCCLRRHRNAVFRLIHAGKACRRSCCRCTHRTGPKSGCWWPCRCCGEQSC
jgi:hypothetical protein